MRQIHLIEWDFIHPSNIRKNSIYRTWFNKTLPMSIARNPLSINNKNTSSLPFRFTLTSSSRQSISIINSIANTSSREICLIDDSVLYPINWSPFVSRRTTICSLQLHQKKKKWSILSLHLGKNALHSKRKNTLRQTHSDKIILNLDNYFSCTLWQIQVQNNEQKLRLFISC